MKIAFVTFTGPDSKTRIADMNRLSQDYPSSIEWGILLSRSNEGGPRFPSHRWMKDLIDQGTPGRYSGHLCGRYARELIQGNFSLEKERGDVLSLFSRFQINFHGLEYGDNAPLLKALEPLKQDFIFQMDGVNDFRFHEAVGLGLKAFPLFDQSHGEGVLPATWKRPIKKIFCGYAGGLGPKNLTEQLKRIESMVLDTRIWIDMETHVRNEEDRFDLGLVARCMDQVLPYLE